MKNTQFLTAYLLLMTVTFVQTRAQCTDESLQQQMKGIAAISPGEPNETRIPHYAEMVKKIGPDCLPILIKRLSSSSESRERKLGALVMIGIAGIQLNASVAVPDIIAIIKAAGGKNLSASDINFVYQAHVALARIGTTDARDFLYGRAKGSNLDIKSSFRRETALSGPPPEIFTRGMAIQSLAYIGDDGAEDFLVEMLRSAEFRKGGKFYEGSFQDGDLRSEITTALRVLASERNLKQGMRAQCGN